METFAELIRKAQRGDLNALRDLVLLYEPLIRSECSCFGLWQFPEWSHSDLSQEVTMRVLTRLDQFRGADQKNPKALFQSWLRVVAQNTVRNILRRQSNTFNSPGGPIESLVEEMMRSGGKRISTASSIVSRQEQQQRIRRILLNRLDDECREVLRLRIVEGHTYQMIAEQLNLSLDQVRYRFESSLKRLRTIFFDNPQSE